jgi:DNA-binding FadR family transcriptional regulator
MPRPSTAADTDAAFTPVSGFEPVQKRRAFEEILSQLEEMIVRGDLKAGDRLPNERLLCEMLGVSRPSLREALRVLEGLEIIEVRPGAGAASGSIISTKAGGALSSVLRMHLALGHFEAEELIEFRRVLERWTVSEAAKRRTDEHLATLERLVETMEASLDDEVAYRLADAQFHVAIAEAAGNGLMLRLMEALRDPIVHQIMDAQAWSDWERVVKKVTPEHREIYEAIRKRKPAAAWKILAEHLSFYEGRPA